MRHGYGGLCGAFLRCGKFLRAQSRNPLSSRFPSPLFLVERLHARLRDAHQALVFGGGEFHEEVVDRIDAHPVQPHCGHALMNLLKMS